MLLHSGTNIIRLKKYQHVEKAEAFTKLFQKL